MPLPNHSLSTNSWPRETWTFAGYGDPQSALRSAFWASTTGDAKKMVAGFSPRKQAWLSSQSDERVVARLGFLGTAKSFRIVDQQVISDDLVNLTAYLEGPDQYMKMQMRRFGDEWKLDEHLGTELPVERSAGVGIVLYQPSENESPQVRGLLQGMPAQAAGIEPGSVILAVNGTSTAGLSIQDCTALMRGPENSQVVLDIANPARQQTNRVTLPRTKIVLPN